MPDQAYAVVVIPENRQAIMSEAGGKFSKEELALWMEKNGPGGFFLREQRTDPDAPKHPYDCMLFTSDQFHQLYMFEKGDADALFRPVKEKQ